MPYVLCVMQESASAFKSYRTRNAQYSVSIA